MLTGFHRQAFYPEKLRSFEFHIRPPGAIHLAGVVNDRISFRLEPFNNLVHAAAFAGVRDENGITSVDDDAVGDTDQCNFLSRSIYEVITGIKIFRFA